jgi:plastocyanin
MKRKLFALLHVALGFVAAAVAGAAAAAEPTFALSIAPGKFDEHCLRIEAGEAIRWRFTATAAVDFNIHAHRGERVIYPVRRDGTARASGTFRAKAAEHYCLMWTNRGAAAVGVHGSIERRR